MATIFVGIAIVAGIAAVGSFVGSSVSHLIFSDEKKNTNEIKSEIHVMSNEIKGINIMELVIIVLVVFVVTAIVCIACLMVMIEK